MPDELLTVVWEGAGGDSAKATSQDFVSKGPQIVEDLPAKTGKEELKARMEELNK